MLETVNRCLNARTVKAPTKCYTKHRVFWLSWTIRKLVLTLFFLLLTVELCYWKSLSGGMHPHSRHSSPHSRRRRGLKLRQELFRGRLVHTHRGGTLSQKSIRGTPKNGTTATQQRASVCVSSFFLFACAGSMFMRGEKLSPLVWHTWFCSDV